MLEPQLSAAVYITANISGGHLNPAVTLATLVTGHISILKGLAYILMQICGGVFGILLVVNWHALLSFLLLLLLLLLCSNIASDQLACTEMSCICMHTSVQCHQSYAVC